MSTTAWLILLGTWILAIASPGPDFLAILKTTLTRGLASGRAVAMGVVVGNLVWITAALAGITALISSHPPVYIVLRTAGAVFLTVYGLRILWALYSARRAKAAEAEREVVEDAAESDPAGTASLRDSSATVVGPGSERRDLRVEPEVAPIDEPGATPGLGSAFRLGLVTNLVGNPKAVVFYGALFASILPQEISLATTFAVGISMIAIALVWFNLVAQVASLGPVVRFYERAQPVIDTAMAVLFVVLGIGLFPFGTFFG